MRFTFHKNPSSGFSIIEGLLVVVVVVAIAGVGGYVLSHKKTADNSQSRVSTSLTTPMTAPLPATSATIDQLAQQDGQAEAGVDSSADAQAAQNATSADDNLNNVGGSYDESTL